MKYNGIHIFVIINQILHYEKPIIHIIIFMLFIRLFTS